MKLELNIEQQSALMDAYRLMDGFESVTPGVENGARVVRVPYKLGAQRRMLVKNLATLKSSLAAYDETRREIFIECFPDWPEGKEIREADNPEGWKRFQTEIKTASSAKDAIDLLPLPEAAVYNDNEFPALALAVLEEHGLIEG